MLGGDGLYLGAFQGHLPQLDQPGPLTEGQHLLKEVAQGRRVFLANGGEGAKHRRLVGGQQTEANVLLQIPNDAVGGGDANAESLRRHFDHQVGMIGWAHSPFLLVATLARRQVPTIHDIHQEMH